MKIVILSVWLVMILFLTMSEAVQAQYDDIQWRTYIREAMAKGQIVAVLKEVEAEAAAEEKASRWNRASIMYDEASSTAGRNGQLQKSLTYAQKAFEVAERSRDPWLRSVAISRAVDALKRLGKPVEAKEWIMKGMENVNRVEAGGWREAAAATFNAYLGWDFLRTREVDKAIDHLAYAVQLRDSLIRWNERVRNRQHVRAN